MGIKLLFYLHFHLVTGIILYPYRIRLLTTSISILIKEKKITVKET